jgi:hypothetical protein
MMKGAGFTKATANWQKRLFFKNPHGGGTGNRQAQSKTLRFQFLQPFFLARGDESIIRD